MIDAKEHLNLLGLPAEDKVTGLKGVVTSISFDLYGCVQALIHPGTDNEGKLREQTWLDINRLKITNENPVMDRPDFNLIPGPAEKPNFTKA